MRAVLRAATTMPGMLGVLAWLTSAVIQTGSFGTVDTSRRYQVTRALWRGEQPVPMVDFPDYGLLAPDGRIHAWYGIGQSFVTLPADLFAGGITRAAGLSDPLRAKLEMALVAFLTFPLLAAANALLAYTVLRRIGGFSERVAAYGVLGWVFGTTFLHYAQVHFENSLDLGLCLVVALAAFHWAESGSRRALALAGVAAGFNVLTRLTTLIDASLIAAAALVAAWPRPAESAWFRARVKDLVLVFAPIVVVALGFDRAYHVARFGWSSALTTYIHLFGEHARRLDPSLPAEYPFSGAFSEGFLGPLVSANRSMFLFDPLALLVIVLGVIALRRTNLRRSALVFVAAAFACVVARLLLYSTYAHWNGSTSWSNRFTLTPLHMALVFVVPRFLAVRQRLARPLRVAWGLVFAASVLLQVLSVLVNANLEDIQAHCERKSVLLIPDCAVNGVREITGARLGGLEQRWLRTRAVSAPSVPALG